MAKCKACGEVVTDGSRFCPRCGASVVDDKAVIAEALESAQKDFDRDSMATLDKSRITYVCSICGSINRIDQDKCTRCGKPRPRSEYVTALKRINESKAMNTEVAETLVAPLPVQAEPEVQEPVAQEPVVQEPVAQEPAVQEVAQPVVQNVMSVGGQGVAISQPFVVVPYVDSMYPLRQYNPNQLYRYQPYTPEELAVIKAQREAEELQARLQAQASMPVEEPAPVCENEDKGTKKKVRIFAIFTLLLTIFFGISNWMLVYSEGVLGLERLLGLMPTTNPVNVFATVSTLVLGVSIIAGFIHSLVRLCSGKAKCRGWIIGVIMLIGFVLSFVALSDLTMDGILALVSANVLAVVLNVVLMIVYLVLCACSPRVKKCKDAK